MQPWAPSPHGFGDGLGPGGGRGDGGDRAGVSSGTGHHGGPYGPAAGPGGPFGNVAGGGSRGSPTALAGYAPPGGGLRRRFTQNLLHRRQSDLPPEGPSAGLSPEPVVYRHGSTMNTRAAASPRPAPPNAPRRSASPPVPPRRARGSTRRERKLLRDLEYVRGIPVSSIGFWASLYRFFLILFIGGREGLKTVLDDAFHLTWCEQIRLLIAPLGFHTMQGALFAMMALSVPTTWKRLPGIAAWPDFFPVSAWQSLSVVDRSAVVIIGISFAVELFAFTFTAPFFDVLFVAGGTVLRLLSEYLLIRSIAVSLAQQLPTTAAEQNGSRFVGFAVCCLFVIRSLYHVLALIVPGCFALCGKRLMTCRREKKKGYEQAPASDEWRAGVGHREVYSVSNALNFTVCRHFLSPISYNALLVGPDVVKGIRLLDNMAHAQLCDIMLTVGLQFYALTMHINWYDLGVFIGHDVFLGIYAVVGQTIRILAQRRFELKLLLDQLVLQRSIDFRLPGDDEEDVSDEGDLDTKGRKKDRRTIGIVTLADIEEEYQVEGFFSSPGNIFPQIF
ncbi:hypothetical protein BESB_025000 [Besnoitia besnoiti]|uniref:Transmembrane protein n=1 Tax=Besnoitia besnoiti TaxID=94643 RepID=A0A2A9M2U0_BESBE|nr:uncharacterized protein BESB_025000 [Besnoitia besnoiti]PFH31534.1 hypothetical protein BESB_025000 [Besnoitia besnoiti]